MCCKSAIYLVESGTGTTVTEGNAIPTGNIARRFGCNISQSGTGLVANGNGYYQVTGVFSISPSTVGVVGVSIRNNGTDLGNASQVYANVANEPVQIVVSAIVRNGCADNGRSFIEFVLESGRGTIVQSSIIVEKI